MAVSFIRTVQPLFDENTWVSYLSQPPCRPFQGAATDSSSNLTAQNVGKVSPSDDFCPFDEKNPYFEGLTIAGLEIDNNDNTESGAKPIWSSKSSTSNRIGSTYRGCRHYLAPEPLFDICGQSLMSNTKSRCVCARNIKCTGKPWCDTERP